MPTVRPQQYILQPQQWRLPPMPQVPLHLPAQTTHIAYICPCPHMPNAAYPASPPRCTGDNTPQQDFTDPNAKF